MKLTIAEPKLLIDAIKVLEKTVREAKFRVEKDFIYLLEMDPANVMMTELKILASSFVEYDVKEPLEFGLNIETLKSSLRLVKPSDVLTLEIEKKELPNNLKLTIKGNYDKILTIPIIEIESDQKLPELDLKAKVVMPSKQFKDLIKDFKAVAESVKFSCNKSFILNAESNTQKLEVPIEPGENIIIENKDSETTCKYSLEFLSKITEANILSKDVIIEFSKDYPATFTYNKTDKLQLRMILAPRVTGDD